MNKSIFITGANGGLGKDTARQLALIKETEKIYLACRNETKAKAAKADLENKTGRSIFEIVIMDVSKPESVRKAVATLTEPVDALIMSAGGMGGKAPFEITKDGTNQMFATNLLGHVVLVDELLKSDKLKKVALYAGSEAARGIKSMGMKVPILKTYSVEEFSSIINGTYFNKKQDRMVSYGLVKYMAALWMSAQTRKKSSIRFITMSPGMTSGTAVMDDITGIQKIMTKYIMMPIIMPLTGMVHGLETGAKRFVDGIKDTSLTNGGFYASKSNKPTGSVNNQNTFLSDFDNVEYQNNVDEAIHEFIK